MIFRVPHEISILIHRFNLLHSILPMPSDTKLLATLQIIWYIPLLGVIDVCMRRSPLVLLCAWPVHRLPETAPSLAIKTPQQVNKALFLLRVTNPASVGLAGRQPMRLGTARSVGNPLRQTNADFGWLRIPIMDSPVCYSPVDIILAIVVIPYHRPLRTIEKHCRFLSMFGHYDYWL